MTRFHAEDPAETARWVAEKDGMEPATTDLDWLDRLDPGWLRRTGQHPTRHACDRPSPLVAEPGDVWRCPAGHVWVVDGGGRAASGIWRTWRRAPWTTRLRYAQWGMWLTMTLFAAASITVLVYVSITKGVRW